MQYINSEGLLIDTIRNEARVCGITNTLNQNAVALLGKSNTVGASSLSFQGNDNTITNNSVLLGGQLNNLTDSFLINGSSNTLQSNSILLNGTGNTVSESLVINGTNNTLNQNSVAVNSKNSNLNTNSVSFYDESNTLQNNSLSVSTENSVLSASISLNGKNNTVKNSINVNGSNNVLNDNTLNISGGNNIASVSSVNILGSSNTLNSKGLSILSNKVNVNNQSVAIHSYNSNITNKSLGILENEGVVQNNSFGYGGNNNILNLSAISINSSNTELTNNSLAIFNSNSVVSSGSISIGKSNNVNLKENSLGIYNTNSSISSNSVSINNIDSTLLNRSLGIISNNVKVSSSSVEILGTNNVIATSSLDILGTNTNTNNSISIKNYNSTFTNNSIGFNGKNNTISNDSVIINGNTNTVSNSSVGIVGLNNIASNSSVGIVGLNNIASNSSVVIASTGVNVSNTSVGLVGLNNTISNSSAGIVGTNNTISNSSAGVVGANNTISNSSAGIVGTNNTIYNSSVGIVGLNNTISNSSIVIASTGVNASNSSVGLVGLNNSISGTSVSLAGLYNIASNSSVIVAGSSIEVSNSSVGLVGLDNTISNTSVGLAGLRNNISNSSVGIVGLNNIASNSSVTLASTGVNVSNSSAGIVGANNTISNSSAGIVGANNTISNSSAGVVGANNTISNSSAGVVGANNTISNSSAGIVGTNNTISNSSAGIVGLNNTISNSSIVIASTGVNASNSSVGLVGVDNIVSNSSVVVAGSSIEVSNSSVGLVGLDNTILNTSVGLAGLRNTISNSSAGIVGLNNTISNSSIVMAGSSVNASNSSVSLAGSSIEVSNSSVSLGGLRNNISNTSIGIVGINNVASGSSVVIAGSGVNASNSSVVLNSTNSTATLSSLIISGKNNIINNNSIGLGSNDVTLSQNRSLVVGGDNVTLNATNSLVVGGRDIQGSAAAFNLAASGTNIISIGGITNRIGNNSISIGGFNNRPENSSIFIGGSGNSVSTYNNVVMLNVKDVQASANNTLYFPRAFGTGDLTVQGNISAGGYITSINTLITTEWVARLVNYLQTSAVFYADQRNTLGNYNIAEFYALGVPKLFVTRQGIGINTDTVPAPYVLTFNGSASGINMLLNDKLTFGSAGDTNLYRSTTDTLKTDDSLIVTGNVGVGVTTANTRLDVGGKGRFTSNAQTLELVGTDHSYIGWYPDSVLSGRKAWTGFGGANENHFSITNEINDGTGHVILTPGTGARVGIGTTSPGAQCLLHVKGTTVGDDLSIRVENTDPTGYSSVTFGSDQNTGIFKNGSSNTGYAGANSLNLGHVGPYHVGISTNNTTRFIVTSDGNVGIGQTNPYYKLEVQGGSTLARPSSQTASSEIVAGDALYVDNTNPGAGTTNWSGTLLRQYGKTATGTSFGVSNAGLGMLLFQNTNNCIIGTNSSSLPLIFANGNGEKMRIANTGNVGIGSSAYMSYGKLSIVDGSAAGITSQIFIGPVDGGLGRESAISFGATFSNGWGGADFAQRVSGKISYGAYNASADPRDWSMKFFTGNAVTGSDTPTERMRINSSGKVGIGRTDPTYMLDVFFASQLGGTLGNTMELARFGNYNSNVNYLKIYQRRFATGVSWNTAETRIQQSTDTTDQTYISFSPDGDGGMAFGTGSGFLSEKMRILSGGNVGIGTITPSQKLHVTDNTTSGDVRIALGTGVNTLELIRNGAADNWVRSYGGEFFIDQQANKALIFRTNVTEKMRILSGGSVLINTSTTDDSTLKLDVVGRGRFYTTSANVFQVVGSGAGYADATNGIAKIYSENNTGSGGWVLNAGSAFSPNLFVVKDNGEVAITANTTNRPNLNIRNTNAGTGAHALFSIGNDTNWNKLVFVVNSSTRTADGGAGNSTIRTDSGSLLLGAGGASYHILSSNGFVGIGSTSTPTGALDVTGNAYFNKGRIGGSNHVTIRGYQANQNYGVLAFTTSGPSGISDVNIATISGLITSHAVGSESGGLQFGTVNAGVASEKMWLDPSGKLGIGIAPTQRLHVVDTLQSDLNGTALFKSLGGNANIRIDSKDANYHAYQTFSQGGVGKFELGINNASDFYINPNVQFSSTGAAIYIKKSDGNVGINYTNPQYNLHVNGTVFGNHKGLIYGDVGTSYSNAFQIREAGLNSNTNTTDAYRPRLGFHWGSVVASSISLRTDGAFSFDNNPGTGRQNVYAQAFVSQGAVGWYNETYGGGWHMSDTSWIRTTNSKNIWTGSGLLGTDGGLTVGFGGQSPGHTGGAIIKSSLHLGKAVFDTRGNGSYGGDYAGLVLRENDTEPRMLLTSPVQAQMMYSTDYEGVIGWSFGQDAYDGQKFKIANHYCDLSQSTRLTIDGSGRIGVGTSDPLSKLDVRYSASIDTINPQKVLYNLHLIPSDNTNGNATGITFGAGADGTYEKTAQAGIYSYYNNGVGNYLIFGTSSNYSYGVRTAMLIDEQRRINLYSGQGTAASPTLNFRVDGTGAGMGIYPSSGNLNFAVEGTRRFRIQNDGAAVAGYLYSETNIYANQNGLGVIGNQSSPTANENGGVIIRSTGNNDSSFISFQRDAGFAVVANNTTSSSWWTCRLGMDTDNKLKIGGGSTMPGVSYEILHAGNTGDIQFNFKSFSESTISVSIVNSLATLDASQGTVFGMAPASNTTIAITNVPTKPTGSTINRAYSCTVMITWNGTPYSVTWPSATKWANGVSPVLSSGNGKTDIITMMTMDGGTNWFGFVAGKSF